ncbi:doublesex cognate 73A [Cotesia typhae]|uniref:doublesex cognate 73A n=1 Tax=Cotesia typhae TaxID=2053667 RepID=UPI003D69A524
MKLSFLVIMVCSGCCMSLPSTIIPTSTRNSSNLSKKTTSLANITASPLATRAKVSENAITTDSMSTSSTSISGITASGASTGTSKSNSNTDNNNSYYGNNSSTSASSSSYSAGASTIAYKKIQLEQVQVTSPSPLSSKETRESPPSKIRPQIKLHINYTSVGETGVRLPEGASAALAKPTKYHYYPHNQHMYLLPECAVQQVCNAVYVRLNFTQPLCACPGRYRDPCSASLDADDQHTTELVTDPHTRALTLVKTCEPVAEMRECRMPRDWSLLALQNVRTGKSHYLVICKCPETNILEGPMSHDQPTYASVPGISVFGMMCVQGARKGRPLRQTRNLLGIDTIEDNFENYKSTFPWHRVPELLKSANWN